ncbi:MAG: hypothetical protein ACTSU2_02290 [Promethearchaeota archaeon]
MRYNTRIYKNKQITKFKVKIDNTRSMTFYQRDSGIDCVIKKDLLEYDTYITASEGPITNEFLKSPDSFETTLADIKIFQKEIVPITMAISSVFGEDKYMSLDSIRIAIGSNENDYVTIDENDLYAMDIEPSLGGLLEFIQNNKEGIVGFCDRLYQPEKGNVIFFESRIKNPDNNIKSIEIRIISSLQQRGLYMQQNHKYYVLQLYTIIRAVDLSESFLDFLKSLNIEWEVLFLRRDLGLSNWIETECERSAMNLKAYIRSKYDALGYFDVNNISRLVVRNQLSFKIADRIADLLNKEKMLRYQGYIAGDKTEALNKAEIAAAAKLACAYFGYKGELKFDKDVNPVDVERYSQELIKI